MTSNFKANKGGSYSRPQLSPEEYKEKKRAEKEAVYQMLDDTAAEVVQSPEKFKGYLDVQSRMDRYTANNALLMYKQFPQASQVKEFDDWISEGALRPLLFSILMSTPRRTVRRGLTST